jgi:hypothetical protein
MGEAAVRRLLLVSRFWLLASGFSLLATAEEATRPPVAVEMSASPAQVAMGGAITVTIRYRWPSGWRVAGEPNPTLDFADEFVTAAPPPVSARTGGEERRTFTITVNPTRSGAWELPRPRFAAAPPDEHDATKVAQAQSEPVTVQVGPAQQPITPPEARPLVQRPPADQEARHRALWITIGVAVLAIGGAIAALLLRRRNAAAGPNAREILARELAAAAKLADGKEAGARISLGLRRFAGAVWAFDGPGSTAREAAAAVRARGPEGEARELARLLESLEAVRWAPDALVAGALAPLIDSGNRWGEAEQKRLDAEREAAERERRAGKPTKAAA